MLFKLTASSNDQGIALINIYSKIWNYVHHVQVQALRSFFGITGLLVPVSTRCVWQSEYLRVQEVSESIIHDLNCLGLQMLVSAGLMSRIGWLIGFRFRLTWAYYVTLASAFLSQVHDSCGKFLVRPSRLSTPGLLIAGVSAM